jgi:cytochrome c553
MLKNLPIHIVRLIFLLVFFMVLALGAKVYLTDPSFYQYGHYRADAIPELAAGEPLFRGAEYCKTCHDESQKDTSKGAHKTVQCEVCHGTGRNHPEDDRMLVPTDTIRLCSTCHEAMPSRPDTQPQIVVGEHPSHEDGSSQCHSCHDPHSPADESPLAEAGAESSSEPDLLTALVSKCAKCHGKQGEGRRKNPALAGLESAIFIEKMNRFKFESDEKNKMSKYAKPLSDEEIALLAGYYESLSANPSD